MTWYTRTARAILLSAVAAGLTACGQPQAKQPTVPEKKGIYVSTLDCVETAELPFEQCSAAVEMAIKIHNKKLKQYKTLRTCETAEGEGKCERSIENKYRRTIIAYLITTKRKSSGIPLYALNKRGELAYQDHNDKNYTEADEAIDFSPDATSLMEVNAEVK